MPAASSVTSTMLLAWCPLSVLKSWPFLKLGWIHLLVIVSCILLPGYTVHRCDCSRCGGGVAVYYADHLSCALLSCGPSASGVEYLWISIDSRLFSSPLIFGCFYRPPNLPSQSVHDVCNSIEKMMIAKKNLVACGDFNVDMANLNKPYSKLLLNFLTSHSLQQPISSPLTSLLLHIPSLTSSSLLPMFPYPNLLFLTQLSLIICL